MPKAIKFTEAELETIERAMDDYMCYHDPNTPASDLIGGLPVAERVNDIMVKITEAYANLYSGTPPVALVQRGVYIISIETPLL